MKMQVAFMPHGRAVLVMSETDFGLSLTEPPALAQREAHAAMGVDHVIITTEPVELVGDIATPRPDHIEWVPPPLDLDEAIAQVRR